MMPRSDATIYVLCRNMKNIRVFLSENFQFLEVKFSIYLNRFFFCNDCIVCQLPFWGFPVK